MVAEQNAAAGPAGTVLAFDYGTQRIGVAVGETATGVAHPLTTLAVRQADTPFERIAALIAEWHPALLLVGLPTHADGTSHAMTARSRRFAEELRGRFALPIAFADERFTTKHALCALRESGASRRARDDARDSVAAQIMLQAYLDARPAA